MTGHSSETPHGGTSLRLSPANRQLHYLPSYSFVALIACVLLLFNSTAIAQSIYGSIYGTVTDPTGAPISGVKVVVADEAKGTTATAITDVTGNYALRHLNPDPYRLTVIKTGFESLEIRETVVAADVSSRIDATLQAGHVYDSVVVDAAEEVSLETDRAEVSTIFTEQQITSLPVLDQNFAALQLLLPGSQTLSYSHAADENPQGSLQIEMNGQMFGGTGFELDGTDNQDPLLGIIVINPALDSVTETKITSQNYDAELGKASSAIVSAYTKSGTNHFHGSVHDFRSGNANLARDPYTEAPGSIPSGLKNRFGGSIGGPIRKGKLFFFADYEGQRQRVGTANTDTLPTNRVVETCLGKMQTSSGEAGCDFSEYLNLNTLIGAGAGVIYDQPARNANISVPTPYANNVIPTSEISSPALALLKYLEPYTTAVSYGNGVGELNGLADNYHATGTGTFNSNQWTARGDYALKADAHAFVRFSRFTDLLAGTTMFGAAGGPGFGIDGFGGNSNGANDSLASGMDITINPKLITDFRIAYFRYNIVDAKVDQRINFADILGIPGVNLGDLLTGGSPEFLIAQVGTQESGLNGAGLSTRPLFGDGANVNSCNCPLIEHEDQFQAVDNITREYGQNFFKAGVDVRYARNLRIPSDDDRAGTFNFSAGPTGNPLVSPENEGGLGFATFLVGDVTSFSRYVSSSNNAKEFQKRVFFYGQDMWRAKRNLTINLGVRWDLIFPETINAPGNGALLSLSDGYLHVAGIGGVPSNMGWSSDLLRQFAPRIGVSYQIDHNTVVRVGYGRSFGLGIFGATFGHTITQNLPVLADQSVISTNQTGSPFSLSEGPPANVMPTIPANGLLPNPGALVVSKARPVSLRFPTLDAWNLSLQHALTHTLSFTAAYVGSKGTHTAAANATLGSNVNEPSINLPASYSVTGQPLHYDPSVPPNIVASNGGTSTTTFLQRYYGSSLPACRDAAYVTPDEPFISPGMCGWSQAVVNYGDDQNTNFNALQLTLAQQLTKGLSFTANYMWAAAFSHESSFSTWSKRATYGRDPYVRNQQLSGYGSYDIPLGRGKRYMPKARAWLNRIIGHYQLSAILNWAGGLPFSVTYAECDNNLPYDAPCMPNSTGRMKTGLSGFIPSAQGTGTRTFYQEQTLDGGVFSNPGLDTIGNAGNNTYFGPRFFDTDLALAKNISIKDHANLKLGIDAFNAFNHINAGLPSGAIESAGTIASQAYGASPRQLEFYLRVEF